MAATPRPPARRVTWDALLSRSDVAEACVLGSTFGFMAFHGGLEAGTLEIAQAAAVATGASIYTVTQPAELRWHVPSAEVDPARSEPLRQFLDHVRTAVAIHGYGGRHRPVDVLIGGGNRALAALVASEVAGRCPELKAVDDLEAIPTHLRGLHRANPVNRPSGGGVQVELPGRARLGSRPAQVADALAATARRWAPG